MPKSSHAESARQVFSVRFNLKPITPIDVLRTLHPGEGAAFTLHRKVEGHWENLGALATSNLCLTWPVIATLLSQDGYFSINSTYSREGSQGVCNLTGLPYYSRKAEYLRWLNAIFVDIDVHATRQSCRLVELFESFTFEIDRLGMPKPNLVCTSGRGMWGLWMLLDHSNRTNPVPAFPERREVYQRVNRALAARLSVLGADSTATDPSRVMRAPGSTNTFRV